MQRKKSEQTMSEMLREALSEADSLRAVERATGVKRQGMMRFIRREQTLLLDAADKLAEHFGITCKRLKRDR